MTQQTSPTNINKSCYSSVRSLILGFTLSTTLPFLAVEGVTASTPDNSSANVTVAVTQSSRQTLIESVSSAVVAIETSDGSGTGFIVQADGLVITNKHVVGTDRIVTIKLKDGRTFKGEVVALADDCVDLAAVKIPNQKNLPTVPFATNSRMRPGEEVFVIGNPVGLFGSFKDGAISRLDAEGIQSTVPLDPGDSGSPLLAWNGTVLGVNTFIRRDSRVLSFAIPGVKVQSFLKDYHAGKLTQASSKKRKPITVAFNRQQIKGALSQGDAIVCSDKSFYDAYQFEVEAGQAVMIHMESQEIVPFLSLLCPHGKKVAIDENESGSSGAVIIGSLPESGTYTLIANSVKSASGSYNLTITPLILWRDEALKKGDRQLKNGSLYRQYEVEGKVGQTITITSESSDFDTRLFLLDATGNVVAENDDRSAKNSNAALTVTLPHTGTYTVVINAADSGAGRFSLAVR